MRTYRGRVSEIRLDRGGGPAAWIDCPRRAIPSPGRYLLAADEAAVLAEPLFAAQVSPAGFLAAPPVPARWHPGAPLSLIGPFGRGFRVPADARRLAVAALGDTVARVLPLITQALGAGLEVALFSDAPLPGLPSALEAQPLDALEESAGWVDFLALDLPLSRLPELRAILGSLPGRGWPSPAQALVQAPMPCGGIGECGVCAVPVRGGDGRSSWLLACRDGPVFDLSHLDW